MQQYLSTVRHLTAAQIGHRILRTIRRRCWTVTGKQINLSLNCQLGPYTTLYRGLSDLKSNQPWTDEIEASIARARTVAHQTFCFLNRTVTFNGRIRWDDPAASQLWRFHLHYFDYLRDILIWAASGELEPAYQTFRRLTLSWIHDNRTLTGDGWHAYTISLRVVNWLNTVGYFRQRLGDDPEAADLITRSIYAQSKLLYANLEFDVRGNHLIENLKALIWSSLAFEGPEAQRWLQRGLEILEKETAEQVLSDGGHFERCPSYHLRVFNQLLETAIWLKRNGGGAPGWLNDALQRMRSYLWAILTPDGRVPLLKDSTWDGLQAEDVLNSAAIYFAEPEYKFRSAARLYPVLIFGLPDWERLAGWCTNAAPQPSAALPASAHYVIRDRNAVDYLIMDAGKPCPDYLPAHAHADLLTYEMSFEGQRIIVDSGTYEYSAGRWRDYFRSTRAHNTVEVAGENQSEVWSSFRVGRRARPGRVFWYAADGYVLAQGEHDGYCRLSPAVKHQRTILYVEKSFWLIVDQLSGRGEVSTRNYIHLHPQLDLEKVQTSLWAIKGCRVPLWLYAFEHENSSIAAGETSPKQGWYSEKFGEVHRNVVLTLGKDGALPFSYGYLVSREVPTGVNVCSAANGQEVHIQFPQSSHKLTVMPGGDPRVG